ncbi:MAG: hypothetical protein HKO01_09395 [Flaviramulus sp.]|nr:hypothetical protein [Flaviramulus sp.]NNC50735.1 hypothetical protein [Flaviramulus sp.]
MSKDLKSTNQSDEVDLGQLFKLIGNVFDRLFKFIASIFISIYNICILILTHFYKRIYWYAGAILVGLVIGFIIDAKADKLYGANLFIEANFSSSRQVYENIQQFNQLANIDKDTLELAKRLNITAGEASNLKGFYIEPDLDENSMAEMYSDFYLRLDSLSRTEVTFSKYKDQLTPYNFKIHKIGVASTDKMIYKKIETALVEQISGNPYLKELVEVNKLNLEKKDEVLFKQVQKTDSLVNEYLKIRLKESEKEPIAGAGTNLYMGNAESSNLIVDESTILDKRLSLEAQRRQVNVDMAVEKNVINVLADFPYSGYDIREWHDKMKYTMPLGLFIITLFTFLTIGLGNFLKKQNNL